MLIGTSKELFKADELPWQVKNDIRAMLEILDNVYGAERDVFHGDGGFVVVVEEENTFEKIKKSWSLDIRNDISEYEERISGYVKRLFILSSDFSIIAYIKEELL